MRRLAFLSLVAVLLTGCATAGQDGEKIDLRTIARDDIQQAYSMATNIATDPGAPYRARCYATLLRAIPERRPDEPRPDIKGVISAYELAAETAAKIKGAAGGEGLISEAVQADCAYIVDEVRRFAIRNAARGAGVPGAGFLR